MADVIIAAGIYSSKHGFYKCHNLSKLKEESISKMNLMLLVFTHVVKEQFQQTAVL